MSRIVLDASVLLAILHGEPGAEKITDLLDDVSMSTVNIAEAFGKLVSSGIEVNDAWEAITAPVHEIVAFDENQAEITGRLMSRTRALGLSLGDRACLALGIALKAPIYTADRPWKDLKIGVPIHVIRH